MKQYYIPFTLLLLTSIYLIHTDSTPNTPYPNPHSQDHQILQNYLNWKQQHNIIFNTKQENAYRFEIFRKNYLQIQKTNQQLTTFSLKINKFACLTPEEFQQIYLLQTTSHKPPYQKPQNFPKKLSKTLPKLIDWRKLSAVTSVKSQGNCGSCWAFSVAGALEGLNQINSGNLLNFSPQQMLSCDKQNMGCQGGYIQKAYTYTSQKGIQTEKSYPYTNAQDVSPKPCMYDGEEVVFRNGGVEGLEEYDSDAMIEQIAQQPISVQVNALSYEFQYYDKGIILAKTCYSYQTNHALLAVGYNTKEEIPYFIVKNSWGTDWGEDGYVRLEIRPGVGTCGVNLANFYPTL